jgi:hypothetical protein
LLAAQYLGERLLGLGAIELLQHQRAIVADDREEFEQRADGGEPAGDGARRLATAGLILEVVTKVVGLGRRVGQRFGNEVFVEILQIAAIGQQGVLSEAALGGEMHQECVQFGGNCTRRISFAILGAIVRTIFRLRIAGAAPPRRRGTRGR